MPIPVINENAELPRYISEQFEGGPRFSTLILSRRSGFEERFSLQPKPRYYYSLAADKQTLAMMHDLEAFFLVHDGAFEGFRFFDVVDNAVDTPTDTVQLSATEFQVVKRYTSGLRTRVRDLYKLEAGSVKVYDQSSVEVTSGFSVDITTGVITFGSAPGYLPRATCSFLVPVRFTDDSLSRIMLAPNWLEVRTIQVEELLN